MRLILAEGDACPVEEAGVVYDVGDDELMGVFGQQGALFFREEVYYL